MSDTNKIITEAKKISELPLLLGFTDDAVVVVTDKGKTAQMTLASLINHISNAAIKKNNDLIEKVEKNITDTKKNAADIKTINEHREDFQMEIAEKVAAQDEKIVAIENSADSAMYRSVDITALDASAFNVQYDTDAVNVGDYFIPAEHLVAAETGTFSLTREIAIGDMLYVRQEVEPAGKAASIILVDEDGYVAEKIPVATANANGYFGFGNKSGTMYLSAMSAEALDIVLFTHKTPINLSEELKNVGLTELVFDLSKMQNYGKYYNMADVGIGTEFNAALTTASSSSVFAHKQTVKPGWILHFEECTRLLVGNTYHYLAITDTDNTVTKMIDTSMLNDNFRYTFAENERYFYLSGEAESIAPVFKLKVPKESLPPVTEEDNGKVLKVVNGVWTLSDAAAGTAEDGNGVAY